MSSQKSGSASSEKQHKKEQQQQKKKEQQQQQQQTKQMHVQPRQPRKFTQADLNRLVLEYLNKKGYHQTEATLRIESTKISGPQTIQLTPGNANFEKPKVATSSRSNLQYQQQQFVEEQNEAKRHQYAEDPKMFGRAYSIFRNWCENSLEMYRYELDKFLYPLFMYLYLSLIERHEPTEARSFYEKFKADHVLQHSQEVKSVGGISLPEHIEQNQIAKLFNMNKYRLHVSATSMNLVLGFLNEHQGIGGSLLVREINDHMAIVTQVEVSTRAQDELDAIEKMEGIPEISQLLNSSNGFSTDDNGKKEHNSTSLELLNSKTLKLGKLPNDPEFSKELEAELKQRDENEKKSNPESPQKKTLMDEYKENFKTELTADGSPSKDVLPLPQKTALDLKKELIKIQDSRAKIHLSTVQAHLPSVCMYTFHNTNDEMTCVEFNDDSTMVAGGFQDSFVKIWSIDGKPMRSVLKHDKYNDPPDGAGYANTRRLIGHSGAVYGLDFSPDGHYLLSASEDKTVRMWSLDTYTALVSYKGHNAPVWDVKFSPLGHYFATASHDQTARLWSCDHIYPLRIFAGHLNDVDVVDFHPNSTYVFTGSSDRTVRMWDIARGESVRVFIGHTMPINALACSPDGRWLATAGEDSIINVFDIASGRKLKSMRGHGRSSIYSLAFSRDGSVLLSGGSDNSIRVWDIKRGTLDRDSPRPEKFTYESVINAKNADETTRVDNTDSGSKNESNTSRAAEELRRRKESMSTPDQLAVYFTKKTPVYKVHFTRRNLCLAAGVFMG